MLKMGQLTRMMTIIKSKSKGFYVKLASGLVLVGGLSQSFTIYEQITRFSSDYKKRTQVEHERKERESMLKTNVAQGLVMSHYYGYLKHVLPDLEQSIKKSEWYTNLRNSDKENVSMKLYELIPRKCITGKLQTDQRIEKVSDIEIKSTMREGNIRELHIPMYKINDGERDYYCLCECPAVLATIKNMDDIQAIQTAEKCMSGMVNFGFSSDEVLIQLMRFYYYMSAVLSKETFGANARLLLYTDVKTKISDELIHAIKEDLSSEKEKANVFDHEHKTLMDRKLLSAEEQKDIGYNFDVYVTSSEDNTSDKDKKSIEKIVESLSENGMQVLKSQQSLGKDWSENLLYAATQCRWIIFLRPENSKEERFISSEIEASLGNIMKERKVLSVPVLRTSQNSNTYIPDNLRWVSCVSYDSLNNHLTSLYNIVGGREIQPETAAECYFQQGDIANGLAWGYAVNYINKVIPRGLEKVKEMEIFKGKKRYFEKLCVLIPESCKTNSEIQDSKLPGLIEIVDHTLPVLDSTGRRFSFTVYKLNHNRDKIPEDIYFTGQYAAPISVLRDMNDDNWLSKQQMQIEVKEFAKAIQKIMKMVLPKKGSDCEFLVIDEHERRSLSKVLEDTIIN